MCFHVQIQSEKKRKRACLRFLEQMWRMQPDCSDSWACLGTREQKENCRIKIITGSQRHVILFAGNVSAHNHAP